VLALVVENVVDGQDAGNLARRLQDPRAQLRFVEAQGEDGRCGRKNSYNPLC